MSHPYTPTPTILSTVTCPDDGDLRSAASVNAIAETLANSIAWFTALGFRLKDFTASSEVWAAPAEIDTSGIVMICGGGGGGGAGYVGVTTDTIHQTGGGGGGGALLVVQPIALIASGSYTWTRGAGGAGGVLAVGEGSDGGDSTFAITAGATLATGRGGGRAMRGVNGATTGQYGVAPGGSASRGTIGASVEFGGVVTDAQAFQAFLFNAIVKAPSSGGSGFNQPGGVSSYGVLTRGEGNGQYAGGAAGALGADAGAKKGGGGGGGGGAGAFGVGATGGAGGAGHATTGVAGTVGTAGGANTGAGGGGGGAGGCAGTTPGASGNGGAGGSGRCYLFYRARS